MIAMDSLPTLFLFHGAPDLPLQEGAVVEFLRSLHQHFAKPKAILVVSAHWYSAMPLVSAAVAPRTIHDFSGFPAALYKLNYPAPGSPELADHIIALLNQAGIAAQIDPARGFDHGAWTPLVLTYPAADIPVVQLSIQYYRDVTYHRQLGKALAALRQEEVLVIGSGSVTHNLQAFSAQYDAAPPSWVQQFDQWLGETIAQHDWQRLMQYRQLAPYANENHPTEEHLLPLFVALGAAGAAPIPRDAPIIATLILDLLHELIVCPSF